MLSRLFPIVLVAYFGMAGASACESPVRVFVLAGQSNMEGHGQIDANPRANEGRGSLEQLATAPETRGRYERWRDASGTWVECDGVFIEYFDRRGRLAPGYGAREDLLGPELGFGAIVGDAFNDPVLLVKIAWGGKSLAQDFRPPSAGGETGEYYRRLINLTRSAVANAGKSFPELEGREFKLVGFGWHQGWNDRVNQTFNDEYEANLAHFIRDVRRDLGVEQLPFVIAETGMNGLEERHPRALSLMAAQAAVAKYDEFLGNVAFVSTREFYRPPEDSPSGQGYHWNGNAETYYLIGEAMGLSMLDLLGL